MYLGTLSELIGRGGITLRYVKLQRKLKLFFGCERITLSVQDCTEHAMPYHPARLALCAFSQ